MDAHLCGRDAVFLGNLDDVGMIEDRPLEIVLLQLPRVTEWRVSPKGYTWNGETNGASGVLPNELCKSASFASRSCTFSRKYLADYTNSTRNYIVSILSQQIYH